MSSHPSSPIQDRRFQVLHPQSTSRKPVLHTFRDDFKFHRAASTMNDCIARQFAGSGNDFCLIHEAEAKFLSCQPDSLSCTHNVSSVRSSMELLLITILRIILLRLRRSQHRHSTFGV